MTSAEQKHAMQSNHSENLGQYAVEHFGCLQGHHAVWSANNTILDCEPDASDLLPAWVIPIAVVVCLSGILLLVAVGLLVWLKLTVQLRRKWQREKELNTNRLKGVPNGGTAAIVVTDVEKYSGTTRCQWQHCKTTVCMCWAAPCM